MIRRQPQQLVVSGMLEADCLCYRDFSAAKSYFILSQIKVRVTFTPSCVVVLNVIVN